LPTGGSDEKEVTVRRTLALGLVTATFLGLLVPTVATAHVVKEGCTPGFWKNHPEAWVGYAPTDSFEAVVGRDVFDGDPTLMDVLGTGGGGLEALGRAVVAALLSAAHPDVDYRFSEAQIISLFQQAFDSGSALRIDRLALRLDAENNRGSDICE